MRVNDGTPFVVYAVDTPTYPEKMFGCRDILSIQKEAYTFEGSAVVISGGHYKSDSETGADMLLVFQSGLVNALHPIGRRFAERAVTSLVESDERVIVDYDKRYSALDRWADIARGAGFQVEETKDDAICIGNGALLAALRWLEGVWSCSGTFLIASHEPESALEMTLIEGARSGADLYSVMVDFWNRVYRDPDTVLKELGGSNLFTCLGGPDGDNLAINRRDTDVSRIEDILASIAADLGVALYNAGKLSEPDESGDTFGDFSRWLAWEPLPKHWKRVV